MATPAPAEKALESLHRELLKDGSLQFKFEDEVAREPPPEWLEALMRFLGEIAPYLGYIFWAGIAIGVALIIYMIVLETIRRLPQQGLDAPPPVAPPTPQFRPVAARARALLEEADRLAREGRYGEAVRVLLHRSIEDMEEAFPQSIAPHMTSREIGKLEHLSERGRSTFSMIASAVEASLFAGRALTESQFSACRQAYQRFVFESAEPA